MLIEVLKSRGISLEDLENASGSDEEIDSDDADETPKIRELKDGEDVSEDEDDDASQSGSEDESSEEEPEMKVDPKLLKELNKKEQSKNEKKRPAEEKVVKQEKRSKVDEKPAEKAEKPIEKPAATEKKTLPSGLVMEDFKVGTGPKAKKGKKVSVRYIGKLANGKTFDSNTKGAPFQFKLGAGEVIKGWDIGVVGMAVGGTRKLTIPAALAYGSRGAPPEIPKNATLTFEVKLLQIK